MTIESRALEALVETLLDGKKFPDQFGTDLHAALEDDYDRPLEILAECLITKTEGTELRGKIEQYLRDLLEDGYEHLEMIERMEEDAKAEAAELRAEINKEIAA